MPKKQAIKTKDLTGTFKEKVDAVISRINDVDGFRDSDTMIDFIFRIGRELFDTPLDKQNTAQLIRNGGKLTGAYVWLGQKSAFARGQRDVYEQKCVEVEKERLIELLREGVKVTEARALVQVEIAPLNQFVIEKDIEKNQWENITEATEKMVSFIQSAIKVKEGERFQSATLRDNG